MKISLSMQQVVTINRTMDAVGKVVKIGQREEFKTKLGDAKHRRRIRKALSIDWTARDLTTSQEVFLDAFTDDEVLSNEVHSLWIASQQGKRLTGEQMEGLRDSITIGRNTVREYEISERDANWLSDQLQPEDVIASDSDDCLDIADILDSSQPTA